MRVRNAAAPAASATARKQDGSAQRAPRDAALGALGDMAGQSPRLVAQRKQADAIDGGARMAAQRAQAAAIGGGAARGLPRELRSAIEQMSGVAMDGVQVHYNSPKPAQLQAHAYAQGANIHLAPGRERHLAHEAWHVVQQRQGRVQPTVQAMGVEVNDDPGLEREADEMGARAVSAPVAATFGALHGALEQASQPVQRAENQQPGRWIGDAAQGAAPGLVGKLEFLAALEAQIQIVAKQVLEPAGLAQVDCPDLRYWMTHYKGRDASYLEQAILRYSPAAAEAVHWQEALAAVVQRVEQGLRLHVSTGANIVDPEPAPASVIASRPDPAILGLGPHAAPAQLKLCGALPDDSSGAMNTIPVIHREEKSRGSEDSVSDEDRAEAKRVFAAAEVRNYTDVAHQLFVNGVWTGVSPGHLVNKWERQANGEGGLGDYDPATMHGRGTGNAEAGHLQTNPVGYGNLAARFKMQFAMLHYKYNTVGGSGFGSSYFVISQAKAIADGFIHFGDSGVKHFVGGGKGAYSQFPSLLDNNDYAVKTMLGRGHKQWIEVNLAGGVDLPGDIDELCVDPSELATAVGMRVGSATPDADVTGALNGTFGNKVRYL